MSNKYITRVEDYLKELYKTPILENFLGLEIKELEEGKVTYQIRIKDLHSNLYGFVHGGTLASISDVAMGIACVTLGKQVVTIDMSISYIKNAKTGSIIKAIGEVISNGRTIMRATGQIFDENDQLLVSSQASYYITGDFNENFLLEEE